MSESDPLNQPQTVVFCDLIGVGIAPVSKKKPAIKCHLNSDYFAGKFGKFIFVSSKI